MTFSRWQLLNVAMRSFLLQASWNYNHMMNMGFLYSISPCLDVIYEAGPEREEAYLRHFEYFNTNPYFSSIVMGVTLKLEEKLHNKEEGITPELIHTAKENLMTSLAAVGDGLFWDNWRPYVAVFAIALACGNILLTPFIFLLLYNVLHLYLRFAGVFWGYEQGVGVSRHLKKYNFPHIRETLRMGTLTLLTYLIPNYINIHTPYLVGKWSFEAYLYGEKLVQGLVAIPLVALGVYACRQRVNVLLISFLLIIVALVFNHWDILI